MKRFITQHLLRKNPSVNTILVLFSDSIVLVSRQGEQVIVDSASISSTKEWKNVIELLIGKYQLSGRKIAIVLGHGLYQSLLIDKPDLSDEELPLALPYLVKDLVNESPEDLVADGFVTLQADRLQVFVANRHQINDLIHACKANGCQVVQITVESVAWRYFTESNQSQLVVHRHSNGNLQLTAFSQHVLFFQRQLRGFNSPLVSEKPTADQELLLDNLALELQRSLDFLSAQLRQNPINQLIISCDDEDDRLLADALTQRLNVVVSPLVIEPELLKSSGARIAWATLMQQETLLINLFSEQFKTKSQWLTLTNVVSSWAVLGLVFVAVAGTNELKNRRLTAELTEKQNQLTVQQTKIAEAKKQLLTHIASPLKIQLSSELEQQLITKQTTLKAVAKHDTSLRVGYANVLRQLAEASSNDIALEHIYISGKVMDLQGLARTPDAVPRWLSVFNRYSSLTDRRFQMLNLDRNEDKQLTFTLQAKHTTELK